RLPPGAARTPEPTEGTRGSEEAPTRPRPSQSADRPDDLRRLLHRRARPWPALRKAQRRPRPLPAADAQQERRERPAADLEPLAAARDAPQPQVHRLQRLGPPRQTQRT